MPQLLADVVAEGPDSERIVMTMTYTFKAAGQLGGITKVGGTGWGGPLGLLACYRFGGFGSDRSGVETGWGSSVRFRLAGQQQQASPNRSLLLLLLV